MDLTSRRIARLSDDLVDKIAAGEVVERPASVVKELVENALDAGASQVRVEIESGGKTLVRVRDDGCGMSREDARLSVERHATSKLRTLEDLERVATHGFRGEALPSIAAVSHFVLRTHDGQGPAGTEVEVRHGKLEHVRDCGHPRGTSIDVRDLFGAVPARRKFLRADATETGHVAEAVTLLALARPGTGFTLVSGGRTLIEAPAVDGLAARVFQVLGPESLHELAPVEGGEGGVGVRGFVARPDRRQGSRPSFRIFVNGRAVRDRGLNRAVSEAYRAAGAGEPRGDAVLLVELAPELVDVNVHPAKTEVRFADARIVWRAVQRTVRAALSEVAREAAPRVQLGGEADEPASSPAAPWQARIDVALEHHGEAPPRETAYVIPRPPGELPRVEEGGLPPQAVRTAEPLVLGQHRDTYIVVTDGEDLLLVDQHTAHERVRFELLQQAPPGAAASQLLLQPAVFQMAPRLLALLEEQRATLAGLGYDVEPFGAGSVRVAAVPALLGLRDPRRAVEGVLRDLLERSEGEWVVASGRDRVLATVACHSSVRAGEALQQATMAAIVRDVLRTRHPTLCPHGRPTFVRLPREDVTRWFGRTGWRRQ